MAFWKGGIKLKFKNIAKNITGVSYGKNRDRFFKATYRNRKIDKRKVYHLKKYGARNAFEKALNFRKNLEKKYGIPNKKTLFFLNCRT